MAALIPSLILGGGAALALVGVVQTYRSWRLSRLVAGAAPTPISALDAGLHEVRGVLQGETTLESPFSRRTCLYWRLVVEQRRRNRWETLLDRKKTSHVWLDDGGGRLVLHLDQADVIVSDGQRVADGILGFPSGELTDLLARVEESPEGMVGPFLRYHEEVLVAGDRLNAMGEIKSGTETWEIAPTGEFCVVSDRDEAEVVRHQERVALRWLGLAAIGTLLIVATWLLTPAASAI